MRTLSIEPNSNAMKVATLVKQTRIELSKENKHKYTVEVLAKALGCCKTHYLRLERGEKEFYKAKWIYGASKMLEIPLDQLIGIYLNLSAEEIKKNFTITLGNSYSYNNNMLIKEKRKNFESKVTHEEIAEAAGCSCSHISHIERGERLPKDIRLLYVFASKLDIPLWVLIRNELGLNDEDMKKVISISPQNSIKLNK